MKKPKRKTFYFDYITTQGQVRLGVFLNDTFSIEDARKVFDGIVAAHVLNALKVDV